MHCNRLHLRTSFDSFVAPWPCHWLLLLSHSLIARVTGRALSDYSITCISHLQGSKGRGREMGSRFQKLQKRNGGVSSSVVPRTRRSNLQTNIHKQSRTAARPNHCLQLPPEAATHSYGTYLDSNSVSILSIASGSNDVPHSS